MSKIGKIVAVVAIALLPGITNRAVAQSMQSVSCPYDGEMAMWVGQSGNATSGYVCTYSHMHMQNGSFVTHRFREAC